MVRTIRAVIFDLDGTLLDTEPLIDRANAAVLGRYGRALTPELRARILGRSRRDTDRMLAEAAGPSVDPQEVSAIRAALLDGSWSRAEVMPGALHLVARLVDRGIPMAIATSSTSAALAEKLRRHAALLQAMQVVVCVDHPAVHHPKPAPDTYLAAAADLGVEPSACVAFEDAPAGVRAAVAAGMRVLAVPAPSMRDDPAFLEAHEVLGSLNDADPASWP